MIYGQFKLDKPKAEQTYIMLVLNYKKQRFIYSTGEKIDPLQWDSVNKTPIDLNKRTAQARTNQVINTQITRYKDFLNVCMDEGKELDLFITPKWLKSKFDKNFKINTSNEYIVDVFQIWLDELSALGEHAKTTIEKYTYQKNNLIKFEGYRKKKLVFADLPGFYKEYLKYSRVIEKRTNNTMHRQFGAFKGFLKWCYKNDYTRFNDFSDWKAMKTEGEVIALTRTELETIINADLENKSRLDKVRDLFILGCLTGGRFSDYRKIEKADIRGDILTIRPIKTMDKIVNIPLHPLAKRILIKYDYVLPSISNQKFNLYLKELALKLQFFDEIKISSFIGKTKNEEIKKKWELITSHVARKTFVTLSLEAGMRQETVMAISGHKSHASFQRYMKVTDKMIKNEAEKAWSFLN